MLSESYVSKELSDKYGIKMDIFRDGYWFAYTVKHKPGFGNVGVGSTPEEAAQDLLESLETPTHLKELTHAYPSRRNA